MESYIMKSKVSWHDKIGGDFEFQLPSGGQKFKILSVDGDYVVLEREDSYTLTAVNPVINADGSISWDYSSGGGFTDECRVKEFHGKGASEYVTVIREISDESEQYEGVRNEK
jgi:hypothetical protein